MGGRHPQRRRGLTGTDDFLVHVAVAGDEALYSFVIDRLTERGEVADVRTSVICEHLQNDGVAPPPTGRRGASGGGG